MKKIYLSIAIILLLCSFVLIQKKQSIFNGKDLSGWTIYGTEKWYVEKGHLVCESGPDKQYGYLATDKFYKNFDLTVEFLRATNGNSGVFFRSTIEGTKYPVGSAKWPRKEWIPEEFYEWVRTWMVSTNRR